MDVTPRPTLTDEQRTKLLLLDIIKVAYFPKDGRLIPLHTGYGKVRWGSTYTSIQHLFDEITSTSWGVGYANDAMFFHTEIVYDIAHQATFKYEWL